MLLYIQRHARAASPQSSYEAGKEPKELGRVTSLNLFMFLYTWIMHVVP